MALYVSNPWVLIILVLGGNAGGGTSWSGEFQTLDMCQSVKEEIVGDVRQQAPDARVVARCAQHEIPTSGTLAERTEREQNLAAWMTKTPAEMAENKRQDEERQARRSRR